MNFLWRGLSILLLVISVAFSGCKPASKAQVDEEREAYYMDAKGKLFAEDYEGAVVGFEKALEVNPKNAAAHLELGLIHYEHLKDYVSAIYHFQKMLKLRPDHMMAGQIKDHLHRCKMDFASSVNLGPLNQNTETRLKNLIEAKEALETKVKNLQGQLTQMREVLAAQSEALNKSRQMAGASSGQAVPGNQKEDTPRLPGGSISQNQPKTPKLQNASYTRPKYRKHVIRAKDTFYRLAKHYGVDFKAIQAANPRANSNKLQIGDVINIPYPPTTSSQ